MASAGDRPAGRRQFSNLINRDQSAAEARSNMSRVASTSLGSSRQSTVSEAAGPSKPSQPLPLHLQVEPPSYETLLRNSAAAIEEDPLSDILKFPPDDWECVVTERPRRTVQSSAPREALTSTAAPQLRSCVQAYTAPWCEWQRNYAALTQGPRPSPAEVAAALPDRQYPIDMSEDVATISAHASPTKEMQSVAPDGDIAQDSLLAAMLNYSHEATELQHRQQRALDRTSLLACADEPDLEDLSQYRTVEHVDPVAEHFGRRYVVRFSTLQFRASIEPFFASAALYDLTTRQRVSEQFHFDLNPAGIAGMLNGGSARGPTDDCRQALFSVSAPGPSVFLVVKVEKVLDGDPAKAAEFYCKTSYDDKTLDKAKNAAAQNIARLGQFRAPFAWAAVPLVQALDDCRKRDGGLCGVDLYASSTDKLKDDDLFRYLADMMKPSEKRSALKRLKRITSGTLQVQVSPFDADAPPQSVLTSSLQQVAPFTGRGHLTVEVQEFPDAAFSAPYAAYRNHLYVNPVSLNFSSQSYRNIMCRVEFLAREGEGKPGKPQGEPVIFGRGGVKTQFAETSVAYHNKTPDFTEEVKIELPVNLEPEHHLLFTFYHVTCKETKHDKGSSPAKLVGYAWLPLCLHKQCLVTGERQLPVCQELPREYNKPRRDGDTVSSKFLDGQKPLFTVNVRLDSTVQSDDLYVQGFLLKGTEEVAHVPDGRANRGMSQLCIHNLRRGDEAAIHRHLHVILNLLFFTLTNAADPEMRKDAFEALAYVVGLTAAKRRTDLEAYVKYVFVNPPPKQGQAGRPAYPEIAHHMLVTIQSYAESPKEHLKECHRVCKTQAWFFFELMLKSLAQDLETAKRTSGSRGEQQLQGGFVENTRLLCIELVNAFKQMSYNNIHKARAAELNVSLGYFLRDLMSLMDRGAVFSIIRDVFKTLHQDPEDRTFELQRTQLTGFRLDILRVLATHEHFIALNLPLGSEHVRIRATGLTKEFCAAHYLVGLLLSEVNMVLHSNQESLRKKAIGLIQVILSGHDADPRLRTQAKRARVAGLYFPLIPMIMDFDPLLTPLPDPSKPTVRSVSGVNQDSGIKGYLSTAEKQGLLLVFLHVLKAVDLGVRSRELPLHRHWWTRVVDKKLPRLLDVLHACITAFEYPGRLELRAQLKAPLLTAGDRTKAFRANYGSGGVGGAQKLLEKRRTQTAPAASPPSSPKTSRKDVRESKVSAVGDMARATHPERSEADVANAITLRANLSTEATMVVLDTLELFMLDFEDDLLEVHNELMDQVFKTLMAILSHQQSMFVIGHVFFTLQGFVNRFAEVLFSSPTTEFCAKLCQEVFRYCSSPVTAARETATAFLYLLMRKNFEHKKETGSSGSSSGFARVRVQATLALSNIVEADEFNDAYLQKSLVAIARYARSDSVMQVTSFPVGVEDLAKTLNSILWDTKQIKRFKNDPEMLIDLQYQIADGYRRSPALRLQQLLSMSKRLAKDGRFAEAAQCKVHAAALITEYLHMVEVKSHIPIGAKAFESISPNAIKESAVSDDIGSPDQEGILQHELFDVSGLIRLLLEATDHFRSANMFEAVNEVYKIILPMYEARRDFKSLAKAHDDLRKCFQSIVDADSKGKRYFGTYFRVGFFGNVLDKTIRNKEFVYKEPKITRLPEICQRLCKHLAELHGEGNVVQVPDSNTVDQSKLEKGKAYLQVTFLEPTFRAGELEKRLTDYERNTNLNVFMFETPFTDTGKARGSLEDQRKRKTTITVDQSFPYVKTRLLITRPPEVVELTPLQNATEIMSNKVATLTASIRSIPVNVTLLQLQLQGSVNTTVNEGPAEIARVFLGPQAAGKGYSEKEVRKLRQTFTRFLKACQEGLDTNKRHIEQNQVEYHENLKLSFEQLTATIQPLLDSAKNAAKSARQSKSASVAGRAARDSRAPNRAAGPAPVSNRSMTFDNKPDVDC